MKKIDGLGMRTKKPQKHFAVYSAEDFYTAPIHQKRSKSLGPVLLYFLFFLLISFGTVFGLDSLHNYKNALETNSRLIEDEIKLGLKGIDSNDYQTASSHFKIADKKLNSLKIQLQQTGQYIPYLFYLPASNSKLNESTKIVNIVSDMTQAVSLLSNGLEAISSKGDQKSTDQTQLISSLTQNLSQVAQSDSDGLNKINVKLSESEVLLEKDDGGYYSDLKKELKANLPQIQAKVEEAIKIYQIIPKIFASEDQKNYLILFQNNSELRPAGGFLGSFAVANFQDTALKGLDFQTNIYNIDKPFMAKNPITVPPEYLYITPSVALRDSNYNPDFKLASQKVLWYYNQETGKQAEGVMALDTTLITNLLKIVGPIDMPDYGLSITGDNFLSEIEYQVEIGYFKDKANWPENAPKKILSEMMPKIIGKTFSGLGDSVKRSQIMSLLDQSLKQKHLLFYTDDGTIQNYLEANNYAGRIDSTDQDYIYLSDSNIGGKKSSLNVKETVSQKISIDANGKATKTVDIKRIHQGSYDWPDGINKTFNKLIVPKGSKITGYRLLSGDDFPYSDWVNRGKGGIATSVEGDKTVFSFWLNTKPKETGEIEINYQLPPELIFANSYQLLIQKQPGTLNTEQNIEISSPSKMIFIKSEEYKNPIDFLLDQDTILKADFR